MEQMRQIVLASRPQGAATLENFRLETKPVPKPGPGEFLARTLYLSLDPYMRGRMDDTKSYAKSVGIGDVMEGGCVAEVVESNNPNFAVGDTVEWRFGWTSHAVSDGVGVRKVDPSIAPVSTALGVLGMPGITAFVGLNDHGRPKAGETLVVGAATGAVGSLVGQLAKIYGLRAVGVAGGADKCEYAVKELGFDACLDHRAAPDAETLRKQIAEACPNGVDIYFENVGGKTLEAVMPLMNIHGRIPICGMISYYEGNKPTTAPTEDQLPKFWRSILVKRLALRGFIIFDHYDRFPAFLDEVSGYVRDGKVTYRESVTEGIENAPSAFLSLLKGGNFGKQLVKIAERTT